LKNILLHIFFISLLFFNSEKGKAQQDSLDDIVICPVENYPEFPGGQKEFYKFIYDNIKFPYEICKGLSGKFYVKFFIDEDGHVKNVTVLRGLHPEIDKEVIRVICLSPDWKPATQRGKPFKCPITIPIKISTL